MPSVTAVALPLYYFGVFLRPDFEARILSHQEICDIFKGVIIKWIVVVLLSAISRRRGTGRRSVVVLRNPFRFADTPTFVVLRSQLTSTGLCLSLRHVSIMNIDIIIIINIIIIIIIITRRQMRPAGLSAGSPRPTFLPSTSAR